MKVSVVIPFYNEEKIIGNCLESLMNQEVLADEIILVDNNSSDNSVQVVKKFNVKIIHEKNQGIIPARNAGFNAAQYDIIAKTDADTVVPRDWVKKAKEHFEYNNIQALTGPLILVSEKSTSNLFLNRFCMLFLAKVLGHPSYNGANYFISKKMWDQVKNTICLSDGKVHEDMDLAIHVYQFGGKSYYDKNLVVKTSARRAQYNPISFYIDYPLKFFKTIFSHKESLRKRFNPSL